MINGLRLKMDKCPVWSLDMKIGKKKKEEGSDDIRFI